MSTVQEMEPLDLMSGGGKVDQYALMIGRLDEDEAFWKLFKNKHYNYFKFRETELQGIQKTKYITEKRLWAMTALMGNIGEPRYSSLLSETNLSKLIYLHRLQDRLVGSLQTREKILKNQRATVIGNHGDHGFGAKEYEYILDFTRGN